jgi:hypothetical protein
MNIDMGRQPIKRETMTVPGRDRREGLPCA